tara:strand:+ start:203 stop:1120 length:918 start_codon:yes stop_codon:yes gene_type:complete
MIADQSNKQPLVSIIINCFNGDKYLRKALDSIFAQNYKNWEIIFWDNQSTDSSAKIFKSYKDDRLNYFYAPTHSKILYEAKNFALKKSKGDFIAFLDTDDWWLNDKLEKQIPLFNDDRVGLVYGNLWLFYEKKNKKEIFRKKNLPRGMILSKILQDYSIGSATYVIRKKTLENLKYQFDNNLHIIGDFDINMRIASEWKVDCVQDPVATMRIHGNNESIIKKNIEVNELREWYKKMKQNPSFSSLKELEQVKKRYLYLETMENILSLSFNKSFFKVLKYPFCFKKFKLLLALLLPKFVLKKIRNY